MLKHILCLSPSFANVAAVMRLLLGFRLFGFYTCSFRQLYTKSTQIQTSMTGQMKRTHLKDVGQETFQLFQTLIREQEEIHHLDNIFKSSGFEIRMAGGAVRDLLCHIIPYDIDFATDAKPQQMIEMLSDKPEIRLITTASGLKHGTVTARINDKFQYEITTLRIDTHTDGRHAEVEFINDWKLDASRRDLTINSMFIDTEGFLYDYFDGENDLKNKQIRFVGDPEQRICEDHLRIFRYFRFHTRFGIPGRHDLTAIEIMKKNVPGLKKISGERIWSEMKRILTNLNCEDSIDMIFNRLNIGLYMGFCQGQSVDLHEFRRVQKNLELSLLPPSDDDERLRWKPHTLFASLIKDIDELSSVVARLRLSNLERDTIAYIIANRKPNGDSQLNNHSINVLRTQLALAPRPAQTALRDQIVQHLLYEGYSGQWIREAILEWEIPRFPFHGTMIANAGPIRKKDIGAILDRAKQRWAANNFRLSEKEFQDEMEQHIRSNSSSRRSD